MIPFEDLEYDVTSGVAVLRLCRPAQGNAMTPAMQRSYVSALERAAADPGVSSIVVTGAGAAFCVGADLQVIRDLRAGRGDAAASIAAVLTPMRLDKPVIAAINGSVAGKGLSVALAADIRFAAVGAKFTTAFTKRGLVAEHGSAWLLQRLVGAGRALDLLLSSRVFTAEDASAYGLVQGVFARDEILDQVVGYAATMGRECAPTALAVVKAQVRRAADRAFADDLAETAALMTQSWTRTDLDEGVASFVERRVPRFGPLDPAAVPPAHAGALTSVPWSEMTNQRPRSKV